MFLTDNKISVTAAKNLQVLLDMEELRVKNNQGLALEGKSSGMHERAVLGLIRNSGFRG